MKTILTLLFIIAPISVEAQTWLRPYTEGGLEVARYVDLDETDVQIKGSPGQVYGWVLHNNSGGQRHFKLYDALASSVAVGTTTPKVVITLPAGATANLLGSLGVEFETAITIACVTGLADDNTGAPGANECSGSIFYK